MNSKIKLTTLLLFVGLILNAQKLKKDSATGRWHYTQVFEIKDATAQKIYNRILSNYIPQSNVIQSKVENEKIVLRYQFRLGTFQHAKISETLDIKDGRLRWRISDIVYLKAVTSLSKYVQLDETNDKATIKKINKLLPKAIKDLENKVVNASLESGGW